MVTVIISVGMLLATLSPMPYIKDTLKGKARPRLVSWSVWAILLAIVTIAAISEGKVASAMLSGVSSVGCVLVVAAGWSNGSRRFSRLDKVAVIGAIIGLVVLMFARDALLALEVMVLVDAIAYVPTLAHAWRAPHHESLMSWSLALLAGGFMAIAGVMNHAGLMGLLYPVYSATFASFMVLLIVSGRAKRLDTANEPVEQQY